MIAMTNAPSLGLRDNNECRVLLLGSRAYGSGIVHFPKCQDPMFHATAEVSLYVLDGTEDDTKLGETVRLYMCAGGQYGFLTLYTPRYEKCCRDLPSDGVFRGTTPLVDYAVHEYSKLHRFLTVKPGEYVGRNTIAVYSLVERVQCCGRDVPEKDWPEWIKAIQSLQVADYKEFKKASKAKRELNEPEAAIAVDRMLQDGGRHDITGMYDEHGVRQKFSASVWIDEGVTLYRMHIDINDDDYWSNSLKEIKKKVDEITSRTWQFSIKAGMLDIGKDMVDKMQYIFARANHPSEYDVCLIDKIDGTSVYKIKAQND